MIGNEIRKGAKCVGYVCDVFFHFSVFFPMINKQFKEEEEEKEEEGEKEAGRSRRGRRRRKHVQVCACLYQT
jgi:hypothetical protein